MFSASTSSVTLSLGPRLENVLAAALYGATFGRRGTALEVARVRFGDEFCLLLPWACRSCTSTGGEALADDLRADELAVDVDLLAVGVARERDLADAGDNQRVEEPEQERERR